MEYEMITISLEFIELIIGCSFILSIIYMMSVEV